MHCQNLSSALLLLVVFSSFAASINFRGATFNWKVTEQTSTGTEILLTYRVGWRISLGTNNLCNDFIISNRTIVTGDSPISCTNCSKFTENSMPYYCTDFSNSQDWVTGSRTIKSYGVNNSMVTFASSGCCWSYDLAIESDGSINVVGQVNLMGTTFQGKLNSSPVSGIPLLLFFVQKCSQTVSLRARDPDGDYFYCRWAVGTKECGGVCKHPEEITLLGDTCQLQYAGQRALGLYALAIVIVEPFPQYSQVSRSSVPLQFVVRVVATSHACNQRPIFSEKTKPDGWILQLEQSSLFQQRIYIYTFIDTDPITDFVAASPVGLIQSSIQAVAKRKTEFFLDVTWSPSGDQTGRHDFCFTALTKSGLSTELRCFYLEITDVDECSRNHPCQQECVNVAGSFRCSCRNGYEALNGTHCRDVDECASGSSVCHANAGCMNTAGSYVCSCKAGFSGDGFTSCQDVDECSGNHPCQQECVNVAGSFRCSCRNGYEALNGTHCRDVDECASGSSVCHANAGCMNTAGSYVCSCKAGFSGDGFTSCQDADECSGNHPCQQGCVNVAGSFRCSCNSGYEALNGTHCRDVDECASGSSVCHANAGCMNTAGSYVCSCKAGFSGDGFTSCQGYQSTSLVTLLAFLTVSNIQLLPDRQDTASEAYMELGDRVVRELLGVLSNYSHANRSAEVASKQQVFSGVAFVLRLETLFTSEFNATHYHQIVISDISRAAEGNAFPSIQVVPETVLVRSVAYCLEEKTGQTSSKGTFYWPQTKPGGNASQRCPFGPIAVSGTRKCIIGRYSDALWEKPDVSACSYGIQRTQDLFKLSKTPLNASTVVNISRSTEELTRNTKELTADDTTLASSIINDIVQSNLLSRSVQKNLLKAVSSIMQSNTSSLDAAQQESKSLSKIVKSMASLAAAISLSSQVGAKEVLVGDQVAIHVNRLSRESFTESLFTVKKTTAEKFVPNDFHFPDSVGSLDNVSLLVRFPSDFLKSAVSAGTQKPRLGFVVYNEDSLFPTFLKVASGGAVKAKDVQTTGMVVGIQVEDQDNVNLASPIELTLQNRKKLSPANLRCVFWNFTLLDGVGGWSEKGCSKTASSAESITCACSHLTNFAVLFDPYAGSSPISHAGHKKALSIISTIGAAISIAALAFAIVTYTLFRQLRGNVQTKITLQLCVALLLTLAVFLGAVDRGLTGLPCRIWAIILHYLLLATFCWQFVNAFHLHRIFVVVIGAHIPKFMIKATFFAWVVPLPLVGAAAAVFWMDYNADQMCIVQGYAAYGFLFGPVLFLLLANYILFALVIKSLRQRHKVKDQKESEHRVELKLSLMACSLLGLTWIFGAFAVVGAQLVFQYLFCIFNSFQGLFLCYFQLGRSVMVRQMWVALLSGKGRNYRLPSSHLSNRAASKRKKPSTAQLPEREKSVVLQNPYPTSSKTLPTIISSESHL